MKAKLIITTIISVSLSVLICYVFLMEEQIPYYSFCEKDDITDLLGICISCLSIVLTGYFAILAIDAYGRVKEIKDAQEKAKKELQSHLNEANRQAKEIKNTHEKAESVLKSQLCKANTILKEIKEAQKQTKNEIAKNQNTTKGSMLQIGDAIVRSFEYSIHLIEKLRRNSNGDQKSKERYKKWREETYRDLYSLGLNPLLLDEEKRVLFIKKLSSFAGEKEIKDLKEILNSEESEIIKAAASLVIQQIEERRNESGNGSLI